MDIYIYDQAYLSRCESLNTQFITFSFRDLHGVYTNCINCISSHTNCGKTQLAGKKKYGVTTWFVNLCINT